MAGTFYKLPKISLGDLLGIICLLLLVGMPLVAYFNTRIETYKNYSIAAPPSSKKVPDSEKTATEKDRAGTTLPAVITTPQSIALLPSNVLNLSNWKLTLPVDTSHAGSPDEIKQPELTSFIKSPYFMLNSAKNGVVFRANVDGATTGGSKYPRSELREMTNSGRQSAGWSNSAGTHTMIIKQAITHLPSVKPHVVAAQIHDSSDDVVMVRLEGKRLFIEGDGTEIGVLDTNYRLGAVFTVKLVASAGHIKIYYNGQQKVDYLKSGSGYYFKAGCYTQSNLSRGDKPGAYGEVVIYSLKISHS